MSLTRLWPLVLLGILPILWWAAARTRTNFNRRQLGLQSAVRSSLVVCLLLAMAEPLGTRAATRLSVVYLVDVSESVSPASLGAAAAWIAAANRAARPEHWRVIAFGRTARVLDGTEAIARLAGGDPRAGGLDRTATNLEAALLAGWRALAPGHLPRLVLVSDGHETEGAVDAVLPRLAAAGVGVWTMPAAPAAKGDAWIERIDADAEAHEGEPVRVTVQAYSQVDAYGTLDVRRAGTLLATREVQLGRGANRIELDVQAAGLGEGTVDVAWHSGRDPIAANNESRATVFVREASRVLYVEGRSGAAHYLQRALEEGGLRVDVRPPSGLPATASGLAPYAAVIVSDVVRVELSDRQMDALATYVAEHGGGFVMAGGEAVFGAPGAGAPGAGTEARDARGYAETTLEQILPVTFSAKEDPEDVAVVLVLDKSWSMAGPFIELAKEAAKAAVDAMGERHQIGVVTFNDTFDWPVPLQPARNRQPIKDRISTIVPSSHTNIYPALEAAGAVLLKAQAKTKHIILLSDGQTYPDEYERLVTRMAEGRMTVSTVAVGSEADRVLLGNIARWGRGRSYVLENANDVPQIFVKEVQSSTGKTLVEQPVRPVVRKPVALLAGIPFAAAPPLKGYTSTEIKPTADALLVTPDGDPILARWQYGLGRTAIFTSDVKDRWAADWLRWSGYGKFWAQLVRDVMRRADRHRTVLQVTRRGREAALVVDMVDEAGRFRDHLSPRVEVVRREAPETPSAIKRAVVDLRQTAPGRYEGRVPLAATGDHVFRLIDDESAGASNSAGDAAAVVLPATYPAELQLRPPDVDRLRRIAAATRGALLASPADVLPRHDEAARVPVRLWPVFAVLALPLWFADLLLRRVRVFEPE